MKNNISKERTNFAKISSKVDYPDFLDIQLKSFQSFFKIGTTLEERKEEGLYKTFQELFPITDSRNNFVLEFIENRIGFWSRSDSFPKEYQELRVVDIPDILLLFSTQSFWIGILASVILVAGIVYVRSSNSDHAID